MTNFEFFRNQCQDTDIFAYHIYYKDGEFESRRNTLEELNNIDEKEILYFEGIYRDVDTEFIFRHIDTRSNRQPSPLILSINSTFRAFGFNLLIFLRSKELTIFEVKEQLYREYWEEENNLDFKDWDFNEIWTYYCKELNL